MDDNQLDIDFEAPPLRNLRLLEPSDPAERGGVDRRVEPLRATYPEVIEYIRRLAIEAVRAGRTKLGIAQLWEVTRWNLWTEAREQGFKLNNDFRAPCARYLMATSPELVDVFETRRRTCDDD